MPQTDYLICPLCEAACGLSVTHKDEAVLSVRGDVDDPFSKGYICPKGVAIGELHHDADRLRKPLIKRDGVHVEASWGEALVEIERRLAPIIAQNGANCVGVSVGNPAAHHYGLLLYGARLMREIGTQNVFSASTLDQMPKQLVNAKMYGHWLSNPVPDIERTDLIVIIGANPMVSNGSMWTIPNFRGHAKDLKARGGRMICIDPRRTQTADIADVHHFIRPESDVYFLLGLVHTLFDEALIKQSHVSDLLIGIETLRASVAEFSPEIVAKRCGIETQTIRALARDLSATPKSILYGRMGVNVQRFGTLNSWLIEVVNILCGNLDVMGGIMFPKAAAFAANTKGKSGIGRAITTGRRHSRVSHCPEVMGEFPISCIAEEITTKGEGQIKAFISLASNPVVSSPDGIELAKALDQLDFMLSFDIYLNETTRHADVILPGLSACESGHWDLLFAQLSYRNNARFSAPIFQPKHGQMQEWQAIMHVLAIVRGLGVGVDIDALDDQMTKDDLAKSAGEMTDTIMSMVSHHKGPERLLDLELRSGPYGDGFGKNPDGLTLDKVKSAPHGLDLGALEPRLPEVLRTPTGKIDLCPEMFVADMAEVKARLNQTTTGFSLIGRRDLRSNNSWMHNLPLLAKGPNRCTAIIHPKDADDLGLVEGGKVEISANNVALVVQVEISDEIMRGVISVPHGWGHDLSGMGIKLAAKNPGVNVNSLLDASLRDPLSGNSVLNGIEVYAKAV